MLEVPVVGGKMSVKKFWIRTPKRVLESGMTSGNQKVTLVVWSLSQNGEILYSRATCNPNANSLTGKRDQFSSSRAHSEAMHKFLNRPGGVRAIPPGPAKETVMELIVRDIIETAKSSGRSDTLYAKSAETFLSYLEKTRGSRDITGTHLEPRE